MQPRGATGRSGPRTPGARVLGACVLVFLLSPTIASARWYQVEVAVFRHLEGTSGGGEQWPELMALPEFGRAVELITALPEMSDEPDGVAASGPIAFESLGRDARRLAGVERRLRNAGQYELLLGAGWRQPSFGVSRAKWVYVSDVPAARTVTLEGGTAEFAPRVAPRAEGVVRIKVSRLLHVDIDFLYYHEGTPVRLTETRKLKLREIHYFDHPLFGVVLQVSPYALPSAAPEAEEPADDEAPGPEN